MIGVPYAAMQQPTSHGKQRIEIILQLGIASRLRLCDWHAAARRPVSHLVGAWPGLFFNSALVSPAVFVVLVILRAKLQLPAAGGGCSVLRARLQAVGPSKPSRRVPNLGAQDGSRLGLRESRAAQAVRLRLTGDKVPEAI